jgi:hypothetical protein
MTSQTVWKFPVPLGGASDQVHLEMPVGAEILTVALQHGAPQLWARVDPDAPREMRLFRWAGTGHRLHERERRYIGSIQMLTGALVFHLFECTDEQ